MVYSQQFNSSFEKHQKLVNQIKNDIDKGISFSKTSLARELNMSYTNVCKSIKRLNVEDECITYNECGIKLNYTDLSQQGVFSKIIEMMDLTDKLPILVRLKDKDLCELFSVKITTVQMYKAYVRNKNNNCNTKFRWDNALEQSMKNLPKELAEKLETIFSNALKLQETTPGSEQKT